MKRLKYIIAGIVLSAAAVSCTKVIDVNIDNAPPKVVIEGHINSNEPTIVKLTRSIEVDQENTFPEISNAVITITDDQGNSEQLSEITTGLYRGQSITGIEGRTYTLTVSTQGETYKAVSTMPGLVPVDSITTRPFAGFGDGTEFAVVHYTDPAGPGNNYRAVLYINDTLVPDIFIEDDLFINGNSREAVLFSPDYTIDKGDRITIEINCLDRPIYQYFLELIEADGASQTASPSNPKSNIEGGALGYFSAQTISIKNKIAD